jgi:hypothetical protein
MLLLFVPATLLVNNRPMTAFAFLLLFLAYAVVTMGMLRDRKWGWVGSMAWLAAYWVLYGWRSVVGFAVNMHSYLAGGEPYLDSPGTILVVVIYALFGLFPASLLLVLVIACRREIGEALGYRRHRSETR